MELRHLRAFVVLAEELHFGHAAKRLHITQPPLSASIRQLEEDLGARLFVRDSRSVRLTDFGEAFLPEAIRVVAQARAAEEAGRALATGKVGMLHVGFSGSMLYRGMPEILHAYAKRYPAVELQLVELTTREQNEALAQRRIECGFSTAREVAPGLQGQALLGDEFACCVHESHWVAARRSVSLKMLADEDFVLLARDFTPGGYERMVGMCVRAGFHPREKAHVRQWNAAAAMVSSGFGIAILPASLRRAEMPQVKFVKLEDAETVTAGFFLWNPEARSPALDNLIRDVGAHVASER